MNERIRQLAELADEYTDNKIQMPGEYHPDWHDVRDEKFAESIVQECMQRLKTTGSEESFYSNKVMNYLDCIEDLKLHFGVGE